MRPDVSVPQNIRFLDVVGLIPRSVYAFQWVAAEIAGSAIRARTILAAFLAIFVLAVCIELVRDGIAPEPPDQFRASLGEFGYAAFMMVCLAALYGVVLLLQWTGLRIVGVKASMRTVVIAILASELPQVIFALACLFAFALAHALGTEVRDGSTFNLIETALSVAVGCFFLTSAVSVTTGTSMTRATIAVLLGPGLLFALFLWSTVHPG